MARVVAIIAGSVIEKIMHSSFSSSLCLLPNPPATLKNLNKSNCLLIQLYTIARQKKENRLPNIGLFQINHKAFTTLPEGSYYLVYNGTEHFQEDKSF